MFKSYETDIWNVGIVKAKASDFLEKIPTKAEVVWLPHNRTFSYYADPFGIWKDNLLYIFVEDYDYRTNKGTIECFVLDKNLKINEQFTAIEEKCHLSYPFIIEEKGEILIIPESSKCSETWIYKAIDFPKKWKRDSKIFPGVPLVDSSFLKYNNMWWMFFSVSGKNHLSRRALNVAFAKDIRGPWNIHPKNPVQERLATGRCGGKPFIHKGIPYVPVQDCEGGYGKKVHLLRLDKLTKTDFSATKVANINPVFHEKFTDGLHQFASCGDVTLIDCKFVDRSSCRFIINLQRKLYSIYRKISKVLVGDRK